MLHFQGLVYRAHNPCWSFDPLSADGAKRYGGRFNPIGIPALYTSLTETTALAEYHQGFPHRPQPTTLCTYEVDCKDIANLTDPQEITVLNIKSSNLACAWESIAKMGQTPVGCKLATRLMNEGVAGIIVPSFANNAAPDGSNLIFWQWSNKLPHKVIVIDDFKRLPKDQDLRNS